MDALQRLTILIFLIYACVSDVTLASECVDKRDGCKIMQPWCGTLETSIDYFKERCVKTCKFCVDAAPTSTLKVSTKRPNLLIATLARLKLLTK